VIERYTLPEIGAVWTEEAKYRAWLEVELAVCRARAELGEIPREEVDELAEKADFTVERIHEIEAETNHDVIAFVSAVAENAGGVSRHFHFGLTSSDVLDTAGALQLRDALDLIHDEAKEPDDVTRGDGAATQEHGHGGADARGPRGADSAGAQAGGLGLRDGAEPGEAGAG
jgi:adenylosuccinate lyase